jgi:hypothetical protein
MFRALPTIVAPLGPARLAAHGSCPGEFFNHQPLMTRWSEVMDGVVVFRAGRSPRRIDQPCLPQRQAATLDSLQPNTCLRTYSTKGPLSPERPMYQRVIAEAVIGS